MGCLLRESYQRSWSGVMAEHSQPTVAIVIPNYNDGSYLPVCLDSVLALALGPEQIILVDDSSNDNSVELAGRHLNGVPGAKIVVNPQRLGTMGALNVGLQYVTCDYVLFLASNDHLDGEILAHAKAAIARLGPTGLWSAMVWSADAEGNYEQVFPSAVVATRETALTPQECVRFANRLGNWFTGTTLLFHRATLQHIGGFDLEYRGLADLFAALTISSRKGAIFCPVPFGVMRRHDGGYLWRTLTDHVHLESLLQGVTDKGPTISPVLFTPRFIERTCRRIRFSALRTLDRGAWPNIGGAWEQGVYRWLSVLWYFLMISGLRTALAFVLLRPFDILPMFWYRIIKFRWIVARDRLQNPRMSVGDAKRLLA
jgi:glycosyltransferase involved in cell wall biosynthesis